MTIMAPAGTQVFCRVDTRQHLLGPPYTTRTAASLRPSSSPPSDSGTLPSSPGCGGLEISSVRELSAPGVIERRWHAYSPGRGSRSLR